MSRTERSAVSSPGEAMYGLCKDLYPICRSITGNGVRDTLAVLERHVGLKTFEVPSGTAVFDWTVPKEWNLRRAYIEAADGERLVDTADHNLHVVSYSTPVDARMSREELDRHLFSLPDRPDLIPYRTGYYSPTWGFCLTHEQRQRMGEGTYHVVVDSELTEGSLSYGEVFLPGRTEREILISTHVCHPSLANDNLSGISVATELAKHFSSMPLRYGLRFVFVPSTIGAITWLAQNEAGLDRIIAGLVISGVGDRGSFTYKTSRRADGLLDRIFRNKLTASGIGTVRPFIPYGYDERQYCAPGIDLRVGCLMRTPFGEYPEYHTSADNLSFISADSLGQSFELCVEALTDAQHVARYRNLSPKGEPQLGRRGLYSAIGGDNEGKRLQMAMLWMLSYSDGDHSTLDVSELSGIGLQDLAKAVDKLRAADLLEELPMDEEVR